MLSRLHIIRPLFLLLLGAAAQGFTACQSFCGFGDEPAPRCQTAATVRFPVCNVPDCAEHPTLLLLDDGRQLRPYGSEWADFQLQTGGTLPEHVLIDYKPEATPHVYTWLNATITCISPAQ
jgi:hypothetical protein